MRFLLCLLFLTTFFGQSWAQQAKPLKYYDVEIVIFKNLKVPKGSEQILPVQAPLLEPPFIDLTDPQSLINAQELGYTTPSYDELRLIEQADKISKSSRFELLVHTAWRQPGLALNEALSYKLLAGKTFNNDFSNIDAPIPIKPEFSLIKSPETDTKTLISKPEKPANQKDNKEELPLVWYELEGKITISLARYLHAYVDLVLRIPNENSIETELLNIKREVSNQELTEQDMNFTTATLNNFSLKEHRRMRSKRLHYLDNPEFGMLILITPYEIPEENIDQQQ